MDHFGHETASQLSTLQRHSLTETTLAAYAQHGLSASCDQENGSGSQGGMTNEEDQQESGDLARMPPVRYFARDKNSECSHT
jgi:hypothetical protein